MFVMTCRVWINCLLFISLFCLKDARNMLNCEILYKSIYLNLWELVMKIFNHIQKNRQSIVVMVFFLMCFSVPAYCNHF